MKRSALACVAAAAVLAGAPSRLPNTSIKAHHYDALKDVLIQGDMVSRFPKDLNWVGYNTQPGMTPAKERFSGPCGSDAYARLDLKEKNPLTFSHRSCGKLLSRYDRMET